MKLKPSSFRRGVKFLFFLALCHIIGFVLYSVVLSNLVKERFSHSEIDGAYGMIMLFDLLFWLLVAVVWIVRGEMSYSDIRRNILVAADQEGFSSCRYFCQTFLIDWIWKAVLFLALQLPFAIFYANFGLALDYSSTFIEKIYMSVAGFYAVSHSVLFGLLFSTLYFYGIMMLFSFLKYRKILKNR